MTANQAKANKESTSGLLLTLNRGISVLEQIARDRGRATAKSLAATLEINLGTCYQLLRTLQANGYVHRLPGGRYELGTRIGLLAEEYENAVSPPPKLLDRLHDLHQAVQETAYISIRRGKDISIVGVLEGTRMLRVGNLTVGYSGHPHVRASTKAFLAFTHPDELGEYLDGTTFKPLTPNTITTWDDLMTELKATRIRGYGIDDEEYTEGISCIGAVVLDGDGQPFGAYGVSFPSVRLVEDEEEIARHVMDTAKRGSEHLGYTGPYPPPFAE